jgi:hypothetical protein
MEVLLYGKSGLLLEGRTYFKQRENVSGDCRMLQNEDFHCYCSCSIVRIVKNGYSGLYM